jgi:cytochrome c553
MIRKTALALLTAGLTLGFQANASEGAAKVDLEKGKSTAATICVGCHGADGNSVVPTFPSLAGQGAPYIEKQLKQFKSGQRNNGIMLGMASTLSDEDVKNVAAWYSSQKPNKPIIVPTQEPEMAALGKKIWRAGIFAKGVPACAACHGAQGAGLPAQFPRLAGQYTDYSTNQLKTFRSEERANDPEKMMRMIAAKLSDKEIQAVAEYATTLAQ